MTPRVDVVVLTMNDRPKEETFAQKTLQAQTGVEVRDPRASQRSRS
ncbi:hypothetical protein OH738_39595 [Streptomyces hirsutus]|uniref:Uncharacterized protein n=1 Tax=Streptomyces hirsutus TaxID=35620 RepID=A0ABZ1GE13_9ACTN|nr:hypothetical protein [Streptomyces hirsutus]WSD04378.1 hypothetical protein OIE73_00350 [Streptomyces hirsutus]WTD22232.1 hypothetical protein OH738_39595 [Streptomyces hirsutus]WTD72694.1 hypothetical protein OHB56_00890 [Streptomyces sp. NBC_01635]